MGGTSDVKEKIKRNPYLEKNIYRYTIYSTQYIRQPLFTKYILAEAPALSKLMCKEVENIYRNHYI